MTINESTKNRLGEIIKSCRTRLSAFIRKRVPLKEDAEDILQEIIYQLIRVDTTVHPVEQVTSWLFRAARNEIIDRSRKIKEVQLPTLANDNEDQPEMAEIAEVLFATNCSPEEEYLKGLFWQELENALAVLPKIQRDVFEKTELQGYSFKQLSEETGLSVNTLLSKKHKAVLQLRESLQALYEEIIST
jgi:RNA polymerase sigma factor (sigma-70 family)